MQRVVGKQRDRASVQRLHTDDRYLRIDRAGRFPTYLWVGAGIDAHLVCLGVERVNIDDPRLRVPATIENLRWVVLGGPADASGLSLTERGLHSLNDAIDEQPAVVVVGFALKDAGGADGGVRMRRRHQLPVGRDSGGYCDAPFGIVE